MNKGGSSNQNKSEKNCPSCGVKLKCHEIKSHCEWEITRLMESPESVPKIFIMDKKRKSKNYIKTWAIFQRVQRNRQSRSEVKSRKRLADSNCPLNSTQTNHGVNSDGRDYSKSNKTGPHPYNSENYLEPAEIFEEYEWAGQKRIRLSSLLQGGYTSIGIGSNITNKKCEENEDLNVDEDDTKIYGPPQYTENDITSECSNADSEENYQGELKLENCQGKNTHLEENNDLWKETYFINQSNQKSAEQIIDSLKIKLRRYEGHVHNKFKCLICLDEYQNPTVSVCCWHVHCESCWLKSLGKKKLCPQCNLITSHSDLRRIYM